MTEPSALPIVYRGYVNAWDCDELGHMNVQFYVAKASEGLSGLLAQLGLERAAREGVRVRRHRIRFVKEMHVSDLVAIHGGATHSEDGEMDAVLEVRNGHGDLCAHVDVTTEGAMPGAEALVAPPPDAPGLKPGDEGEGTLDAAAGFVETIRNVVQPVHCDIDGGLAPRGVMARFSEAQGHLWAMLDAPRAWQREAQLATATLEYRIAYGARPPAGSIVRLLTKVVAASAKTVRFRHWLFDAESGEMVAAAAGAALFLDKTTRKAVILPERVAAAAARLAGSGGGAAINRD
jgi:acyl-CoA thioester hydrolase